MKERPILNQVYNIIQYGQSAVWDRWLQRINLPRELATVKGAVLCIIVINIGDYLC